MIDNFEIIKDKILLLAGLEDTPKLNLQIEALINECMAYCYRKTIPAEMEVVVADVIADILKKQELTGLSGTVTSYKEGDMQVSFMGENTLIGNTKYGGKLDPYKLVIGLQ